MTVTHRVVLALAAGLLLLAPAAPEAPGAPGSSPSSSGYPKALEEAERHYAEGSYALSHGSYQRMGELELSADEARWVEFRLADTLWRSQGATRTSDTTELDRARQQLEALVRDINRPEDRDLVWAEVQESLGDFWWTRRDMRNWGQAWGNYQNALDWWGGSSEIDRARDRYLGIVWTVAEPQDAQPYYSYGYYGNYLPLQVVENALAISESTTDRARAHYLLAMTLRQQGGDWRQIRRVAGEFEAALEAGRGTGWYDDALYNLAQWWASRGEVILREDGTWHQEADFVRALKLYRRLVREFRKGETRYHDQAENEIRNITRPTVRVTASNIFLPGSEVGYQLSWRNVGRVELALYPVDLTRDLSLADGRGDWLQQISVATREPQLSWSWETGDVGDHRPGQESLRLDDPLPPGAYLLVAHGGEEPSRDLVLVTDASVVVKASGKKALVYVCDALDGSPLSGADVRLWEHVYEGNNYVWRSSTAVTDADGIVVRPLSGDGRYHRNLFVAAISGDRQAFSAGNAPTHVSERQPWRIQAFTDRPAYRPDETVHWKLVARRYDGSTYSTPSGARVEYAITDPQGTKIAEGVADLNPFGSAWGSLDLTPSMPLGEYRVQFRDPERSRSIGGATLFRLEEYKLPEFRVSVETPGEDGAKRTFRLGDTVEVRVGAEYYFGGPVAGASVEVVVYQSPFYHTWMPHRDYGWYYEDMVPRYHHWYGRGQIVKREVLTTDASGSAVLSFDTPEGQGQDLEYRIEARVTDSSRREVVGSEAVRVTRQGYYVHPRPRHYLHRPQDQVTVDFQALDANREPVSTSGTVTVTRDHHVEVWIDPDGREVAGEDLKRARERVPVFPPPPPRPSDPGWRLKFQGYEHEEILTRTVNTDDEGNAELSFTPDREGYYRVAWSSRDDGHGVINAETAVWVATNATTELGYRHGGVQIIVDRDTFRAGETAPVMLVAPTSDRHILFTVEGEDLYSYQLVHLTGTVKLVQLPITEADVPNIFLSAAMVADRDLHVDTEQVIVPPVRNFLDVEVTYDRDTYQPREDGVVVVRTRDHEGRPISAEVSLALIDESVYYIQDELAVDPRQFFFGTKRRLAVHTTSTFQQRRYRKLAVDEDDQLVDATSELEALGYLSGDKRHRDDLQARREVSQGVGGAMAMDAANVAMKSMVVAEMSADEAEAPAATRGGGPEQPAVEVRSDFRSTMFWGPDVVTGADGEARVEVTFPDSLTTWRATARAAAQSQQFGMATAEARSRKPLIVRLQAPRFFVVGDRLTISAVLNNNTDAPMSVRPSLEAEGLVVETGAAGVVEVPANGEARVDWPVSVEEAGEVVLTVTGRGDPHSDAMRRELRVYPHGIEKLLARSGKMRGDEMVVSLDLPAARLPGSTRMTVQIAPSMAVTMLDALPYLIDYPYGCTEQTMSRFLPAAITARTLRNLGLKPEDIAGRIFGGIEQEHAAATHPDGRKSLDELDRMIRAGLDRLYDFQHGDGGWGWWKDGDSDHYMTAYVVWGLTLADRAGIDVRRGTLRRGVEFLAREIVEEERRYDMQAWMLHALATYRAGQSPQSFEAAALDNLWENRDRLNAYTRALLALSAHHYGDRERAMTLVRNLENGVKVDRAPDTSAVQRGTQSSGAGVMATAHWGSDGLFFRWSEGGIEATAFALRALLAIDPGNDLVEPTTNWLVKNRRGAQWSNTRDTAIAVLTLGEYLPISGELGADVEYEVLVNGRSLARETIAAADALSAPGRFPVQADWTRDGENEIRIVRHGGDGPLYFSAEAIFFSLEEPVTPAGNEIFVRRQYTRQIPRPTLLEGITYEKKPLNDGDTIRSGERVEVVITIEAKNDYEYLVFEDLKPAGLEAVQIRSGEPLYARELKSGAVTERFAAGPGDSGVSPAGVEGSDYTHRSRWVYQELRDRKVALFVDKLPQGVWEIRYDLRAEVPGTFHALPVLGHAMYVPEIRANGAEVRITVEDQ